MNWRILLRGPWPSRRARKARLEAARRQAEQSRAAARRADTLRAELDAIAADPFAETIARQLRGGT